MGVLVAGLDVLGWVTGSLVRPARRVVNDVLYALQGLGLTRAEAVQYVKTPPGEGEPSEVDQRLEGVVSSVLDVPDRFAWYLGLEWPK